MGKGCEPAGTSENREDRGGSKSGANEDDGIVQAVKRRDQTEHISTDCMLIFAMHKRRKCCDYRQI